MAGGGAYNKLQAPDNGISQSLQYWGNQSMQLGQEERARNEREKVRRDADLKEWEEKNGLKFGDFQATLSGFNTPDDVSRKYAMNTQDEYVRIYREAEEAKKSGNKEKLREAEYGLLKLKNSFKLFNDASAGLGEIHKDYAEKAAKGLISGASADWENNAQAIAEGKYEVKNKGGVPMLVGIRKNDDGSESPFEIRYEDVISKKYAPIERQDVNGAVQNVLKNLGSYEEIKQKGLFTVKSTLWNDRVKEAAKTYVDSMLTRDMIGDVLFKINGTKEKASYTEEEKDLVRSELLKMVEGGFKEKYEEDFDKDLATYKLGQAKLAADIANNKEKNAIARQNTLNDAERNKIGWAKINQDEEKNNPFETKVSKPFTRTVAYSQGGNRQEEFRTYTLFDKKKGQINPIVIGQISDGKGGTQVITATSVNISKNGDIMVMKGSNGKNYNVSRTGADPTLYNKVQAQLTGRSQIDNEEIPDNSMDYFTTPTSTPSTVNIEDLREEYGYGAE